MQRNTARHQAGGGSSLGTPSRPLQNSFTSVLSCKIFSLSPTLSVQSAPRLGETGPLLTGPYLYASTTCNAGEIPMKRYPVNKSRSSSQFRSKSSRTRGINLAPPPMRGGFRL
ncbi:MAG: hypothetical protein [Microviridae sp.]|nr:MAG: hypothetical protein [Microviridae sp.]